jgi:hypothetical protein
VSAGSDVWIAALAAVPPTLLALASLVVGIRNSRKVEQVRHATNSLTEQLVAATRIASYAEGAAGERDRGVRKRGRRKS